MFWRGGEKVHLQSGGHGLWVAGAGRQPHQLRKVVEIPVRPSAARRRERGCSETKRERRAFEGNEANWFSCLGGQSFTAWAPHVTHLKKLTPCFRILVKDTLDAAIRIWRERLDSNSVSMVYGVEKAMRMLS